ncbi:hypothetical protein NDU88_000885, partial [Pleurodeles waltl]
LVPLILEGVVRRSAVPRSHCSLVYLGIKEKHISVATCTTADMDKNNTTEDIKNQGIKKNFQRSRNNSDQTSDASGDGSQGEGSSLPTSESEDQPGTRR